MSKKYDELLHTLCIYDSVEKVPYEGCIFLKDGKIANVEKGSIKKEYLEKADTVTECGDKTVCAGFGDTHTFFTGYVIEHLGVDFSDCHSIEQLEKKITAQKDIVHAICLWASKFGADETHAFVIAMWVMAVGTILAFLMLLLFFKEKDVASKNPDDVFQIKHIGVVLKNPTTWMFSIMVLCSYGIYTSLSYFSPYLTDVLGVPLVNSSIISIVRSNLMNLLCPLGGYIIDKIFKSANKWYITAFAIMAAIYAFVMIMPNTVSSGFATFVSLLPAAIAMMLYGVIWSGLKECKFNSAFIGTVIGIGSVLGYAPDFFYFPIFGKWMDLYGNDAYRMIFGFLMGSAIVGIIMAVLIRIRIKKAN